MYFYVIQGLYFAGQYAAPVTCLEEMEKLKIGGVNEVAKASEAKRFYELVSSILQKIDKEKAECCEIIYFDGKFNLSNQKSKIKTS